jgi:N-acetyl-anhydromuramyl-L-alanine amidase AmpD
MKAILMVVLASGLLCSCATPQKVNPPSMLSRAEWQAAPPVLEMKTHRIDHITIHHTAVKQNPQRSLADKLKSLQKFSQNSGTLGSGKAKPVWPDVPYHYYIDCHGQIGEAREVKFVGDTNTAYDPIGHALVVLEGNFEEEQPTAAQLAALREMVAWLAARYQVVSDRVGGHQDFAQTLCPGKNLQALLPELRQAVRSSREN